MSQRKLYILYIFILFYSFSNDICSDTLRDTFYMCPLCDETCDFWYYRTACGFSRVALLFDNGGTVFFAAFMACWGKILLTLTYTS